MLIRPLMNRGFSLHRLIDVARRDPYASLGKTGMTLQRFFVSRVWQGQSVKRRWKWSAS